MCTLHHMTTYGCLPPICQAARVHQRQRHTRDLQSLTKNVFSRHTKHRLFAATSNKIDDKFTVNTKTHRSIGKCSVFRENNDYDHASTVNANVNEDEDVCIPIPRIKRRINIDTLSSKCLDQPAFDIMYRQLLAWRHKYKTTMVPRSAHDAGSLAAWVADIRRLKKDDRLPSWAVDKFDEIQMIWRADVVNSKWHANFHAAREFKEVHGGDGCDLNTVLTPDFTRTDAKPEWIEAARWLERQRELYRKEKLTDYKVWALKTVLGIKLVRKYGPQRRSRHPEFVKQNREFQNMSDTSSTKIE